jgi:Rieske Fe-S protein
MIMREDMLADSGGPGEAGLSRRAVVAGTGAAGLIAVLTGCGGSEAPKDQAPDQPDAATPETTTPDTVLGKTSQVPVGGGTVFAAQKVVVTQPRQGTFQAFTAVCTHKGCTVGTVGGGTINCPCHGSKFSAADGSVVHGPATAPLAKINVSTTGGNIVMA